ncbi:hypothetical protein CKN86_10255 [Carnobacterium divergens]|uniref:SpaA isopeptide-forming pilin-related protein n=1 Tax=Carnobacterium divergens TaxID=2748 RepID=UPI000D474578|nr:SpaA isopeptide-forming pilin-related protein [Carnobacterium divergens]MCO6017786.1 SpaA isopeptide-forming pilin-related protein [Carnobacterium divergens]TFI60797.1 hypothetical protein CKN62_10395 [Carnobacterium divergens]TFI87820.1 hypothetical protein CKN84_10285 [Carnobacterium divergens]TFJ02388.1 hypothetical protein CKN86_10255 [Carnobacterium divergens]TFJ03898.1 hypothetical protein CKN65_10295 [Carnobacterium divergens]
MKFRTPLFTDHSKVPENLDFKVNLNVNGEIVSEDLSPSITIPHITGKPIFTKYSNSSSVTVNNEKQYIMSKDKPETNNFGELKAGTIVTDPLPVNTSYLATQKHDDFSDATYDLIKNTISYTLLKDIPPGESRDIEFTVDYDDSNAQIGPSVVNKASYTYAGTDIYSNDATTLISGSAELQKLDKENNNPLEGAHFKIVDSFGNLIVDNLVTDSNGIVRAGLLKPGNYSFIETRAPEGYVLDPKPNDFSVSEGQTVAIKLMMYNEKEIPVKPVDPIKPIDPVNPVKPLEPIGPAKPVNPTKPIQLVDVSKAENQKQSIKSKK